MRRKAVPYIFLMVLGFAILGGLVVFSKNCHAAQEKLWNLQILEGMAEAGDIEAQLRLMEFYGQSIRSKPHYKERFNYWRLKVDEKKHTDAFKKASGKLAKERSDEFVTHKKKEEEAQKRLQKMKERYEKLSPDDLKNEEMIWRDGLNAIYGLDKIYNWKVPYSWQYRMTVNIETPEGVKSGTTVREVFFPPADKNMLAPSNLGIARGEAVSIDLGGRGIVFAVLPDSSNANNKFKSLVTSVFPTVPAVHDQSRYQEVLRHYDRLRGVKDDVPPESYPVFVWFRDMNDPQTIEVVYQRGLPRKKDSDADNIDRFSEVFGEGVRISSIEIEMTDDIPDWKLEDTLGWMKSMSKEEISRALRQANPSIRMPNGIAYYILRQGQDDPREKMGVDNGGEYQRRR